ncbi:SIR2 family protein [Ignavibacterium sp.]|uniref:SIR2 family protein n=1 Tax=Ignavibacterium sp. TaxID=2651167 RepID=UPI0021FEB412|nr:SIR2 family protein [Ignavibacterium sp.]BDQ01552.1 MAG: hypothetical protein KatS3mg037_0127 [Ignavibacterium sp.]
MKTAIFFGAGASRAEGAPLQGELFKEYFKFIRADKPTYYTTEMERELRAFFHLMFSIDVDNSDLAKIKFPTFEEVLGVLDLAIQRNETLKNYDLDNIASNNNRLRNVRLHIIMSMAQIIHEKLKSYKSLHEELCKKLATSNLIKDVIFLTTNYDILIDNALTKLVDDPFKLTLDYGIDFVNFLAEDDWKAPKQNSVKLFKLHGSLNWLYCPTCNNITLTPKEKGVIRLLPDMYGQEKKNCSHCDSLFVPMIIPPSFFKNMNNAFLSIIWNKVEQELRDVNHIIFCGYSFPDADIHIKYLLKRIQTNRKTRIKFTVINNHNGKKNANKREEELRYKRFLGPRVNYTDLSFEQFCDHPQDFLC